MNWRLLSVMLMSVLLAASTAMADIGSAPDPLILNASHLTGDVVVSYAGTEGLFGYSIDVQWNPSVATAVIARPDAGPFAAAPIFFVVGNPATGNVRIDAALGGTLPGTTDAPLFKITFTAAAVEGSSTTLDFTAISLRDPDNGEIASGTVDDGLVIVDTGAPVVTDVAIVNVTLPHTDDYLKNGDQLTITAVVTDGDVSFDGTNIVADLTPLGGGAAVHPDTYVGTTATWLIASPACTPANDVVTIVVTATDDGGNAANASDTIIADNTPPTPLLGVTATPGHEKLHLAWADATTNDLHFYGVAFRYAAWGDYPEYDTPAPAYPADHLAGTLALQATSGTTADWVYAPRDIYYVAGFVYDIVLNYSVAGTANQARATNYWLGDAALPYDGYVVTQDVSRLGDTYGLPDTDLGFDPECNVGPTDTDGPRGIPLPNADDEVGFEDLMIFALNYGVVSPVLNILPTEPPALAWRQVDETTWSLSLERACAGLKGLDVAARLPEGVSCTVSAGALLEQQSSPVFLQNIAARGLDAGLAILGQGVGFAGAGELARVTLSAPVAGLLPVFTARGVQNEDLAATLSGATAVDLPLAAALAQNAPNPFNPQTTIVFSLPDARHVRLAVYGLDGRKVRTLVDEARAAGRHEVIWDGRDDGGRPAASGAYLYRIEAGDFHDVRKAVLTK